MNSRKLAETLQSFNEMGSAGKNEDLGRNPKSLKALEGHVFMPFIFCAGVSKTIGGLKANGEHQALDWGGKPLKSPYAIDEVACGLKREGGLLMHWFLVVKYITDNK